MKNRPRQGFTLIEGMVATLLLALVVVGLYSAGLAAWRMVNYNLITSEARFLAIQKLDEVVAEDFANIVNGTATSLATQTNVVQNRHQVVRHVEVVPHAADASVTNLAEAAYLELHSIIVYSPMSGKIVTNVYSTIVSPFHP